MGGVTFVVAVMALLGPVVGVHKQIRKSKESAMAWANGELSKKLSAFQNPDVSLTKGEVADLVTYQGLVERVPEWPFTLSTYARFVLYLLIPLLFWGIGIVAEEVVQRALSWACVHCLKVMRLVDSAGPGVFRQHRESLLWPAREIGF